MIGAITHKKYLKFFWKRLFGWPNFFEAELQQGKGCLPARF